MNILKKIGARIKEFFRKLAVSLKRRPNNIVMLVLVISFLYYALNLTNVSKCTWGCNVTPMGLMSFITFLFSILACVSWLNAFPRREKPKIAMIAVFAVLLVAVICADIVYFIKIQQKMAGSGVNANFLDAVAVCETMVLVHSILTGVVLLLAALLPVYSKLLKKIKTSIAVEDNGEIGAIEIESDE